MKLCIAVLALATAALAGPAPLLEYSLGGYNYHEIAGIETAARIKASEEARDFDGGRIYGGAAARLGQYPFMAGTVIYLTDGRLSYCGASLISTTRLTTAAHCWNDGRSQARAMTVVLGSLNLWSGGTRVPATRVIRHPRYGTAGVQYDIAMIHINPITYSNNIRNINLPPSNLPYNGVRANAVGYGQSNNSPNNQSLRHVQMPVMTHQECVRVFGTLVTAGGVLCASGVGGRSICFGDSGGPLQNPAGNVLIGISSFVHNQNCASGMPAGFARVGFYLAWIRQHM